MSRSVSIVLPILLTLVLILSSTHGIDVGDKCVINDSSGPSTQGECKPLRDCPIVFRELLSGKMPKKSCGYVNFDPIVCCPDETTKPITIDDRGVTSTPRPPPGNRGAVARRKCAENAKEVYGLIRPPVPTYDRNFLNVSRCALKVKKLIVGGKKAEAKEFPHMVAIGFDGKQRGILWLCGGSLISDRIVLTAAHCTSTREWGKAKWARLGDLNLQQTTDDAETQTIKIIESIRHPDYKRPPQYHDIAIMKLENAVIYDAYVRPACLPVDWPDVGDYNKAIATGWGRIDWGQDDGSADLLKVTINMVSHQSCNASYSDAGGSPQLPQGIINEWQMCAGELDKDTCQGDSGGPLAVFNEDHECMYNLVGITSLGRFCGVTPGVYTRIYHYIPWIERTAWPEYFEAD